MNLFEASEIEEQTKKNLKREKYTKKITNYYLNLQQQNIYEWVKIIIQLCIRNS